MFSYYIISYYKHHYISNSKNEQLLLIFIRPIKDTKCLKPKTINVAAK